MKSILISFILITLSNTALASKQEGDTQALENDAEKKQCLDGNWEVCMKLGHFYIDHNPVEGIKYYIMACEVGGGASVPVCLVIGEAYYEEGKYLEAAKYFKIACQRKDMVGCANAGVTELDMGNRHEARRLFTKACKGRHWVACFDTALMAYEEGNEVEVRRYAKIGCNKNEARSCYLLGAIEDESGNYDKARKFYGKGCSRGVMPSCNALGNVEYERHGDCRAAKRAWDKACTIGNIESACINASKITRWACY